MISAELISLLDSWVRDAVARHGDDWPAIMQSVEENIASLGDKQRAELSQQIGFLLASSPVVPSAISN